MSLRPKAWLEYVISDYTEVQSSFSVMCAFPEVEHGKISLPADKREDIIKLIFYFI